MEDKTRHVEELLQKQRLLTNQLDEMVLRERSITEETTNLEKSLAILKHDLKEVTILSIYLTLTTCALVRTMVNDRGNTFT